MRSEKINFGDLFQVDPSSGQISLGGRRHLILDADALGSMRRELIDNLGREAARGILERMGYECGRTHARQFSKHPAESSEEFLRIFSHLPFLEGLAKVELTHFEFTPQHPGFLIAGRWQHSCEAEQHLKQYGAGNQCTCWMLAGYAAGFATERFQETLACLEINCRGKGDPECSFEMRRAEAWGNAAQPLKDMLESLGSTPRFDRCLRSINEMGCEQERSSLDAVITPDPQGGIPSASQGAHNLAEIRRLEDELATKNRFMANILQDSADAILTLDPNDIVISWNRGAESIFGYSAAEVVGGSINILVPPDLQEKQEMARIREKLLIQGSVRSYQTERITKDGRRIQVMFTRTAIRDDSGRLIGCSAVLKDVSFFRNLERQLADAEHLATLGELSAGLAHEIKNPLAGIKGAIDVIRDSMPVTEVHREILGDVLHEVDRIDKIVKDLLNYAKPKPPSQSDVFLPEMVQRIVTMVRKSLKNEALSIEIDQRGLIPGFTGDETQLEQVLLNLLLNAQSAMPTGGHVAIRLFHDRKLGAIRIEVRDDGPGIPDAVRKKIFQPFFTTRTDGTGLGLAICLKNVQYHGGTIEVRSKVGQGTQFNVTIPLLCHI